MPRPPLVPGGGAHSLSREGVVGSNSDAGTYEVRHCATNVIMHISIVHTLWATGTRDNH